MKRCPPTTDKQEVTTILHLHITPEADGAGRGTRAATVSLFPFMYSDVGHVTHVELQLFTRSSRRHGNTLCRKTAASVLRWLTRAGSCPPPQKNTTCEHGARLHVWTRISDET